MKVVKNEKSGWQKGFSLLELLIGILIFSVVTGAVYGLLQLGMIDRNRSSRRADVMKNVRAAIHLIGRDALNAGLSFNKSGAQVPDDFISNRLGTTADANNTRDLLTSVIGGNNINFNILQPNPDDRTDVISFIYRDLTFNNGNTITVTNVTAGSSASTARLQTTTNGAANSSFSHLYLIESDISQAAFFASSIPSSSTIDVATGDPLGINQAFNGTGNNASLLRKCEGTIVDNCTNYPATLKRFYWVSYRVNSDGTLVRVVFGNNTVSGGSQIQEMPLAYNVQDLQFKYVLADGTVTDSPDAGADNVVGTADDEPEKFNQVRQVIVTVKVQSIENDEQTGNPETITISGTFATRNIEYDAG